MTELPYKVLVIGDSSVGKTSFTDRYTSNKFKGEYKMTQGGTFWPLHYLGSGHTETLLPPVAVKTVAGTFHW